MVNSQHKHVKNCFPDISFMRPITDLFGSNRNVPVRDPCHSRMWLWTSPWMSGYNWLTRRGACTRLWCRRTAVAWSQRVSGRPCEMPHQRAFLFLFLAAKIDGPWWSVMIFAGTSVSSAGAGCSHWAQRSFLCSHLPNERLRWAPPSRGSWSCTFLVLQGPWGPMSHPVSLAGRCTTKPEVIPRLEQRKEPWPLEGSQAGVIGWVSHYQAKKEASGNQVPEGWFRGWDPWSVSCLGQPGSHLCSSLKFKRFPFFAWLWEVDHLVPSVEPLPASSQTSVLGFSFSSIHFPSIFMDCLTSPKHWWMDLLFINSTDIPSTCHSSSWCCCSKTHHKFHRISLLSLTQTSSTRAHLVLTFAFLDPEERAQDYASLQFMLIVLVFTHICVWTKVSPLFGSA